jgi:predicted secreted hydrolase
VNSARRAGLAWLLAAPGVGALAPARGATTDQRTPDDGWLVPASKAFAVVRPDTRLRFPVDHGAHPDFRTEWWYVTACVTSEGRMLGVQITFFRSRTVHDPANPSRFAPHQLLLAHAAIADAAHGRLRHSQRSARLGWRDSRCARHDTDLALGDWQLRRSVDDRYTTRAEGRDFALDLVFEPAGPPWLQGDAGYSRKGPDAGRASHYYSRAGLRVGGTLRLDGRPLRIDEGVAWLDHEWSSEVLDPRAVGWDWVGLNFDDGSALMAFRIRGQEQSVLWTHGRWRNAGKAASSVRFEPLRAWRSPRSGANYPVAIQLVVDGRTLELQPLLVDQELDARSSTGGFYWEGAMRVLEAGRSVGRGYLELTGYAAPLRL